MTEAAGAGLGLGDHARGIKLELPSMSPHQAPARQREVEREETDRNFWSGCATDVSYQHYNLVVTQNVMCDVVRAGALQNDI